MPSAHRSCAGWGLATPSPRVARSQCSGDTGAQRAAPCFRSGGDSAVSFAPQSSPWTQAETRHQGFALRFSGPGSVPRRGTTAPICQEPCCGGGSHRRTRRTYNQDIQPSTGALGREGKKGRLTTDVSSGQNLLLHKKTQTSAPCDTSFFSYYGGITEKTVALFERYLNFRLLNSLL